MYFLKVDSPFRKSTYGNQVQRSYRLAPCSCQDLKTRRRILYDSFNITAGVGKLLITFQNDGSVIPTRDCPRTRLVFLQQLQQEGDSSYLIGISVVGASGRVKMWRYQQMK